MFDFYDGEPSPTLIAWSLRTEAERRAYQTWFIASVDHNIERLRHALDEAHVDIALDFSLRSLELLGDWLRAVAERTTGTQLGSPAALVTNESLYAAALIGIYCGEVRSRAMRERMPGAKVEWVRASRGASYGQMVWRWRAGRSNHWDLDVLGDAVLALARCVEDGAQLSLVRLCEVDDAIAIEMGRTPT
jgi:hypothetical protein